MRESRRASDLGPGAESVPSIEEIPRWSRFSWLRAGFSARQGGCSMAYGIREQNLGWTAEDEPTSVARNRRALVRAVGRGVPLSLVTLQQVHGDLIREVDESLEANADTIAAPPLTVEGKPTVQGDGLMTVTPGCMLGIVTADCMPVLVADTRTRAVAALHAGWRGTLAGIAEAAIRRMRERYGSRPGDLVAALGPAIGTCCFAVGDEVRDGFATRYGYAAELFSSVGNEDADPKSHLDLAAANRRQLLNAGLSPENIAVSGECTACTRLGDGRRKYFSHRAEHGVTGRMLSVIGVVSADQAI